MEQFVAKWRVWDIRNNFQRFHLFSLAVCCILSALVKLPWWWQQKRSTHVRNEQHETKPAVYMCSCCCYYISLNSPYCTDMEHIKQLIYPRSRTAPPSPADRQCGCLDVFLAAGYDLPSQSLHTPATSSTCKPNALRRYAKPGVAPGPSPSKVRRVGELG